MKLFWFFVVCGFVTQVHSGGTISKYIRDRPSWKGLDDIGIERYHSNLAKIKGIRSAVVDEIVGVTTKFRQNYVVIEFIGELDEVLRKDLHGNNHTLSVDEVEIFFNELKKTKPLYKTNDISKVVEELGEIFSAELSQDQVNHMKTLFGIFEGTPEKIQSGLNYLYGDSATVQR